MSFLKIGSAELLLSFCSAFALYGTQVFHFDSPEEVGRFLNRKNPEAYFESGEKAAGAGALKASGFSRTFRPDEKISRVTFFVYDDTFTTRKTEFNTLQFRFARSDNSKERISVWQLIKANFGWQLRYTEANGIRRFFRLTEAPSHGGWLRVDIVKSGAGRAPCIIALNGHEIVRTFEPYDRIHSAGGSGFPFYDEFSAGEETLFRPNAVAAILPDNRYGSILLKPDEKLAVRLKAGRKLEAEESVTLNLLNGRAEVVRSAKGVPTVRNGEMTMLLDPPPRSGFYFLETRTGKPGVAPEVTRRSVEIQFLNPIYHSSESSAPIRLSDACWDFLPLGSFNPRIHPLTLQEPEKGIFQMPEQVPADWRGAKVLRGEWMNLTDHFKIGQSWYAGWYRQKVVVPGEWKGRRVRILIDDPQTVAAVFLNGRHGGVLEWPGGVLDVTGAVRPGKENEIAIYVQANPLYGYYKSAREILGNSFRPPLPAWRGLPGDVVLFPESKSGTLEHVSIRPSVRKKQLEAVFECAGLTPGKRYTLRSAVSNAGKTVRSFPDRTFTASGDRETIRLATEWNDPVLWELGRPYLYDLDAVLLNADGSVSETLWPRRFGFREVWAENSLLFLNGRKVTLFDDNGNIAPVPESVSRQESFGFTSFYHYQGVRDARRLDEAGLSCGRDSSFLPISRVATQLASAGKIGDSRFWKTAESIIRHQVRRRENHPGIFFHYGPMGGGMARNGGAYNPMFQNGTWFNRNEGKEPYAAMISAARRIYSLVRKNDPARLVVAQDSGSLNDTMMITEYRGFQPLQEMIEIGAFWRKIASKPFFISEEAAPFHANWTDACAQGKGWNGVPCLHEWAAVRDGDCAMIRSEEDKRQLAAQEQSVRTRREKLPENDRSGRMRIRKTPSSPGVMWGLNARAEKITAERTRTQVFFWRADHLGLLNFQFIPRISCRNDLIAEVQAPVTGFLAGSSKSKTAQDHIFRPGEQFDRIAILLNNTAWPEKLTCQWKLELGGEVLKQGKEERTIPPGETVSVPLTCSLPSGTEDKQGVLTVEFLRNGKLLRTDSCPIDVLAKETALPQCRIGLIDPEFQTAKLLDKLGIPYRFLMFDEDFSGFDLIIFGRRSFRYEKNLLPAGLDLGDLLRSGKKILIMEQDESVLRSRFGFRTEYSSSRSVFGRLRNGSVLLNGLPDRVLNHWRGAATLTDGYAPAREKGIPHVTEHFGNGGTWNYLWNDGEKHPRPMKWGNTHNVATVTVIKPDTGNFRTLVDCEYALNYAAAWEFEYGRGRIVFNQLDVCGRTENDPAAERYFRNLLFHSAAPGVFPYRHIASSEDAMPFLRKLNIPLEKTESLNPERHLFILGKQAPADLHEFVRRGGIVFSLPKTQEELNALNLPFPITVCSCMMNQGVLGKTVHPLLYGLANADLFWKGNLQINRMEKIPQGGFLGADGILAEIPYGKGRYIFCQISPAMFGDTELDHWLRPSERRTERLIAMLLNNLHGCLAEPAFLNSQGGNGTFERRVALDGEWFVAKGDRREESAPPEQSSVWRSVSLPVDLQKNIPDWAGRQGRFWYRKRFKWNYQNSHVYLKIACISGENRLWINGKLVGVTNSETDVNAVAMIPRNYPVPLEALRKGSNEILICVDYETDAALGLNGSTGNILFPFEFHLFSGDREEKELADLDLTGKEGWRIQKVSGPSEAWQMEKSVSLEIPCTVQSRLPEWGGKAGWFRIVREIQLPAFSASGTAPALLIGAVDDEDIVFVNGVEIGRTTRKTNPADYWKAMRRYPIPPGLLKNGINRIEILLHDFNGIGSIAAPVKLLFRSEEQKRKEFLRNGYLHPVGRAEDPYWHHGF